MLRAASKINYKFSFLSSKNTFKPNFRLMTEKPTEIKPKPEKAEDETSHLNLLKYKHKPSKLQQRMLVWTGRYKSIEEIPPTISYETLDMSRNKARIKIANYMILLTIIGCICMVISGKRAAARGESLEKMNLEWHRKINEEYQKSKRET